MIPEIDLTELHNAIKTEIAAAFPSASVDYYDRPGDKLRVPAIRFELISIEPANPLDTGTEQLEVTLRFSAEVVVAYKQGGKLAVRLLAASLARFVKDRRFGCPITPAVIVSAVPDQFSEEYETWRLDWEHTGALGVNIWDATGVEPVEVNVGQAPMIGPSFAPDYVQP